MRRFFSIVCWNLIFAAGVNDPGYSFVVEQDKAGFEKASRANFLCCVTGDFCSAPSANPDYTDHELTFSCGSGGGRRT
jgi:hypothetical protein